MLDTTALSSPRWPSWRRRIRRVLRIGVIVVLASSLSVTGLLLWWSPGTPEPFLDDNGHRLPGSISEKLSVPVNGVQQGMVIRGQDASIHGLRHSALTLAGQHGATNAELQARAGHASQAAMAIYQHATVDRDRLLAEKLGDTVAASKAWRAILLPVFGGGL